MAFDPKKHLVPLNGKQYLQVMWRIAWMRTDHPDWGISTELLDHDEQNKTAMFKATVFTDERVIATAHGSESARDFKDYIEKAETKAVGRALAMAGFGTQFTDSEFDEGERIVDSPADIRELKKSPVVREMKCTGCGKDITDYKGKTAEQIYQMTAQDFGKPYCGSCGLKLHNERKAAK